jgi:palmitoyltransferase
MTPPGSTQTRILTYVFYLGVVTTILIYSAYLWAEEGTLYKLIICYALSVVSFIGVQGSDPGYIQSAESPASDGVASIDPLINISNTDSLAVVTEEGQATNTRTSSIDSMTEDNDEEDYCDLCKVYVPIRTHHCKLCNRCVATYDHHCLVINTCIGERNHCRFYWFVAIHTVSLLYCLVSTNSPSSIVALILEIILFTFAISLCTLFGYQSFLVLTGVTSKECGRGPHGIRYLEGTQEFDLPYASPRNFFSFCFRRDECFSKLFCRPWVPHR